MIGLLWGLLGVTACNSKDTDSATPIDDTSPLGDLDGDGFLVPEDCDDADDSVHPGASEICDGVDNDCDGTPDGPDAIDLVSYWVDGDGDGFGEGSAGSACEPPAGTADNDLDCDDTRSDVNPDAIEVCDELDVDEDCNGTWDEACPLDFDLGDADLIVDMATDEASQMGLFGFAVSAGDVDADGVPELFISAPTESPTVFQGEGAVYMVPGTARGRHEIGEVQTLVIRGTESYGAFGSYVSVVPDLDGDGYGELAVGSTAYGGGATDGGVKIFDGPLTGPTLDDGAADVALILGVDGDGCGWRAAYDSGDLDGDGTLDHVVGCPRTSGIVGAVRTVLGPVSGTVTVSDGWVSGSDDLALGDPLTVVGDTDGDGTDDVAIVEHVAGDETAYIVAGPDLVAGIGEVLSTVASGAFTASGDNLRIGTLSAGDTDGDGHLDLFVTVGESYVPSTEIATTTGAVLGFVGPLGRDADVADVRLEDLHFTGWVAPLDASGDPTGDGLADVLAGAPWDRDEAGVAYLFEGPVTSGTHGLHAARRALVGEDPGDRAAWGLSFTPDVDTDGMADALLSAPGFADYGKKKGTFDIGKGSVYLVTSSHL